MIQYEMHVSGERLYENIGNGSTVDNKLPSLQFVITVTRREDEDNEANMYCQTT